MRLECRSEFLIAVHYKVAEGAWLYPAAKVATLLLRAFVRSICRFSIRVRLGLHEMGAFLDTFRVEMVQGEQRLSDFQQRLGRDRFSPGVFVDIGTRGGEFAEDQATGGFGAGQQRSGMLRQSLGVLE